MMKEKIADRDDPDEEEGVEGEDDEHGHLHHPQVARFVIHKEAGRFLKAHLQNGSFCHPGHLSVQWIW